MIAEMKDSPAFKAYMERVQEKAKEWVDTLKGASNVNELYRAQGALNFFDYVSDLPDVMIMEEKQKEEEPEQEEPKINY